MLHGRGEEEAAVDVLVRARRGVLILTGEAGIGKTALLEHAVQQAAGMRILRGMGVESESELAFAGLHLLLGPYLDRAGVLPAPQADALRAAFGIQEASSTDRFLTGLGTLSLLGELAEEGPLLVLIDDAQWLDEASAEALLFAARRLDAEPIVLIFAARDGNPFPAEGLPRLHLGGLDGTAGAALLSEHAGDLSGHVRDRILDEAGGNPLALLELPAAMTPAQRAGALPDDFHPGTRPLSERIERTFLGRARGLPQPTQDLLMIAAASSSGGLDVVLAAGRRYGASIEDLLPAEVSRLIRTTGDRLIFVHPLIRSAVYRGAPASTRMAAHRALAEVADPDRRAWHLAAASAGPDEAVAAELEATAEQARARGGYQAVAAAYERAADLSPDRVRGAGRLAAAALAAEAAGQTRRAADLAERAVPYIQDSMTHARLERLRASVLNTRGNQRAARTVLVDAAAEIAPCHPRAAAFMFLDAMQIAWALSDPDLIAETAARLKQLRLPPPETAPGLVGAIIGLADFSLGTEGRGMRAVRGLFEDTSARDLRERTSLQWWSFMIGDFGGANELALILEQDCRAGDAIALLPSALFLRSRAQLMLGDWRAARASATEGLRMAEHTTQGPLAGHLRGVLTVLAGLEGDEERCRHLTRELGSQGIPLNGAWSQWALSLLDLGHGRHEEVLRRLEDMVGGSQAHTGFALYVLPDLVEAAVRLGRTEQAESALRRFRGWAEASGRPWARAVALRCQAQLTRGDQAGQLYARAVRLHQLDRRSFEQARTQLLYGEWLRRRLLRNEARPLLRSALESFEQLGARPWAERTRMELRAAGDAIPQAREPDLLDQLTPQELQVVRLAATGLSNRDIAAQMFLSPRTVGYHLYKAYPKLGVASRGELARMTL